MATWKIRPETKGNTMWGTINYYDDGYDQEITQDITAHIEDAKQAKEDLANASRKHRLGGFRRMATIPDIVAIKLLTDHNLDIHDPMFMHDSNNVKRLKYILQTEYPDLLIST